MSSPLSEKQCKIDSLAVKNKEEDRQEEDGGDGVVISSQLYLKPAHTTGTLDKAVVLRRIRHRKRVNKVKSAVKTLLSSPFASAADENKNSAPRIRWADDAFAAP
ncbi:hypothetical protein C2S52_010097 [Perilla frutescens var. hirtella]|uniref:Uncharacterized protein n=1 Tax=Perilla frutescens var. hirtella TaxID=608512 RepID=A0AAD4IPV5_PERFH|nr:hypothetical protein C2S53_002107 [Perilla frutescens var. hirtella]KAH6778860.1 hypothetical protein C2S52_010097 [Perilla frutescens var. hirtella]KAH6816947.1 hypothetical protein C2S51_000550 [Perilla frutescens var. frutescens]